MLKLRSIGLLLFLGLCVTGCSSEVGEERVETVPVSGKLYVDDMPFGGVDLQLVPTGGDPNSDKRRTASARVAEDGSFTLTTYEQGDGASPGSYTVSLVAPSMTDPEAMGQPQKPIPPVAPATVTIPDGGTDSLEIRLKSTGKPPAGGSGSNLLGT